MWVEPRRRSKWRRRFRTVLSLEQHVDCCVSLASCDFLLCSSLFTVNGSNAATQLNNEKTTTKSARQSSQKVRRAAYTQSLSLSVAPKKNERHRRCENTTSSTKPEVRNASQRRQRRTEHAQKLVKFGHVISEICETNRQTAHRPTRQNISQLEMRGKA